ncbi:hypothetical protein [Thalassospira xiamenensis]|nr:hypothetical protein [Thalassospira xiamenensis]
MYLNWDYAPPRSWEQFEELCADIFQSAWSDPALVRHGRAGQRQNGVDIVCRQGAIYPVGLQCKKRSRWPESKITKTQIDEEVVEATKFEPALRRFYILTTAPDDALLQEHIRKLNERQRKKGLFDVHLLGRGELVRLATLYSRVVEKHFGRSGGGLSSPLISTWMASNGKLEKAGTELDLSVRELVQDLYDWPTGHIVVRQRESDALLENINRYEGKELTQNQRRERISLRQQLKELTDRERFAVKAVMLAFTHADLADWLLKVWPDDIVVSFKSIVEEQLGRGSYAPGNTTQYLRMSPPRAAERRCSAPLSSEDIAAIMAIMARRQERYGKPLTTTVDELPPEVRSRVAIPRLIRGIMEFMSEDKFDWNAIRAIGANQLGQWTIEIA